MNFINRNSESKRIKDAVISDASGYIIGLIPIIGNLPIPLETIKEFIKIRKKKSPLNYVDWELKDWTRLYYGELSKTLTLPYHGKNYILPQVLFFDNTIEKNSLSQFSFELVDKKFELDDDVRASTEKAYKNLKKILKPYKSTNLRLNDVFEKNGKTILQVQPVKYKNYLSTNIVLDYKGSNCESLRDKIHEAGKLEPLDESKLANNLGINILLLTADGSIILQKRSKEVAFRRGELCPTASGGIAADDVIKSGLSLADISTLREMWEEVGIENDDVTSLIFLGITRELIRGGQPEMFFFGKSKLSKEDVEKSWKNSRDKWESSELKFFNFGNIATVYLLNDMMIHQFLLKIDDFINNNLDEASIPLLTNVALWVKYRLDKANKIHQ